MRAIHFSGCVDPGGHPAEGGVRKWEDKKEKESGGDGDVGDDGIFATTFHMDRA